MTTVYSQINYSKLFFNNFTSLNPAYVGLLETNMVNFNTSQVYSQHFDLNLSTGNISVNIPIPKLNSGIGFHSKYDKWSALDLGFGFIYSFNYAVSENIKVSIGSNFTINRPDIKWPARLLDEGLLFNIDIGLWLNIYGFQIGFTNEHINEGSKEIYYDNEGSKDLLFESDTFTFKLNKSYVTIINYDFQTNQNHTISNSLLIYKIRYSSKISDLHFALNNQLALNNKFILGLTTDIFKSDNFDLIISPNLGINLSDRFKFIMSMDLIKNYTNVGNTINAVLNYSF